MTPSYDSTRDGELTIQKALQLARNNEGTPDAVVVQFLDLNISDLWSRIEADPSAYLMTKDEFALFNYFRDRFTSSEVAKSAVARFWAHYQGGGGATTANG